MWGIDVSKHNGKIDWPAVKASGCQFVIIRAGFGWYETQIDEQFHSNASGCISSGIPFGGYWFSYAHDAGAAEKEAALCYKTITPYLDKMSLPVFLDFEYDSDNYVYNMTGKQLTRSQRTEIFKAFCNYFVTKGIKCGYYTNKDYYQNKISPNELPHPVWLAQYDNYPPMVDCSIVQRSSTNRVAGVSGYVDYNEGVSLMLPNAFISDTTNDEKNPVKIKKGEHYTIKITGEDVSLVCGVSDPPSPQFALVRCRRENDSTFWHVVAVGEPGNQAGIYVDGGSRVCVCEVV